MLKKLVFVMVFTTWGITNLYAQEVALLIDQLNATKEDKDRIPKHLQIARIYKKNQKIEGSVEHYLKALTLQERYKDIKGQADSYQELGALYQEWQGYDKSLEYFQKSYPIYQQMNEATGQRQVLRNMAWSYFLKEDYLNAEKSYQDLLKLYEAQNDTKASADVLNRLAVIGELNKKYPEAINYAQRSLEIYQTDNAPEAATQALNNLGFLYRKVGDTRKAQQSFNQAIDINKQQLTQNNSLDKKATLLSNIGVLYTNLRDYSQAQNYYNQALQIRQTQENTPQMADVYNQIAANHYLGSNNERAKMSVNTAIELATQNNDLQVLTDSYRILSDIYKSEGNLKEYENYTKRYNETKTKLESERNKKTQDLLNKKLIIEQLESKLKLTSSEEERQKLALEQQKLRAITAEAKAKADRERADAEQARAETALAEAAAERAEAERAKEIANRADIERKLALANEEKAIAIANEEKARAEKEKAKAKQADQERKLFEAEAKQAKQEKQQLQAEQKRRNQFYLFATILGFGALILGFIMVSYIRNRQKNKRLQEQNDKIIEQNASLEKQKGEISAQRDKLIEFNEELNQKTEEIEAQRDAIIREQQKSDSLLLNILPIAVAKELKEVGYATPQFYEMVTVLFTDFKGFTNVAAKMTPEQVIKELDYCFLSFDEIIEKYNLEKIKTMGDAYMCAGGIPIPNTTNPLDAIRAGIEIQAFMENMKAERKAKGLDFWELRLGIHTGPLVAGVVGRKKFAYDIWGDAVNLASRMESSGEPGKVNISGFTYELVKDHFEVTYRGKVPAKNKGDVDMYFVERELK